MTGDEEDINPRVWRTVSRLADLLRKSGSAVLTGRSALSLSWSVYQNISTALSISSGLTDSQSRRLNVKLVLDLEYLTTFLARVPRLQLYHSTGATSEFQGLIHLAGLDTLREVTFTKIPVHLIQDLVQLRASLESLALHRCCFSLDSLISSCLGSAPSVSPWPGLSVLKVSHCDLTCLGPCLQWTPGLTRLDCSHNAISDSSGLELLSQLTHLNLSYNKLSSVPTFYPDLALSVLLLGYNNIEQLGPLSALEQLVHLDLTGNCLMHHDVLAPISGLTHLLSLDLTLNPLYSHPRHRDTASSWLSPGLASLSPSLDRQPLSRAELLQVGSSRLVVTPQVSPSRPITEEELPSVSPSGQEELQSVSCEGSLVSVSTVSKRRRRRRRKVREAVITDESDYTTATTETEPEVKTEKTEEQSEVTETLQDLREKYGDDWLRSGASETLHSLLGIEQSQADTDTKTIIQNMVEVERQQAEGNYQTKEQILTEEISDTATSEELKTTSRRSSDEVPDAIDKADDLNSGVELERDITSRLADTEVRAEAKVSVGSDNFYSSSQGERERESSPSDKSCKVNVVRNIPGDDSGVGEELVLVISREQLQEQDRRGVTRARWFLHSLEQMELVGKLDNDRVRAVLMFNTVRKDVRVREYVMSEAGYSTVMALVSEVLEAAALACSSLPSLQCVKCQAVFSCRGDQEGSCPHCGSTMVLETNTAQAEEEETVCLGIPACEMLDLEAFTETDESLLSTTTTVLPEPVQPGVVELSVTADIHSQLPLPDLLPRPEPRRSSSPSPGEKRDSKDRSSSPSLTRSNSSSDISVISSEASIEVIPASVTAPSLLLPAPAITKTNAVSPVGGASMVESSSSDSMVNSLVGAESCQSPVPPSTPLVFKTPASTPVKRGEGGSPPGSQYSSVTTSPVKLARGDTTDPLDDTAAFHSCQESSDTSTEELSEETEPDLPLSPINWNTRDFSKADHRVQLYCELSLFREEEDLLVLAKADIHVRSVGRMLPGVIVVSNKKVYILAITARETEEPGDWLDLLTVGEVSRVGRLVGLVGRLGLALELSPSKPSQPHLQPFYRLSSAGQAGPEEAGDTYQVVVGGRNITERLADQLLAALQERVRSAPIPLTWLAPDQEAVINQQLGGQLELIMTARWVESDSWEKVNIVLASSSLLVTEQFFYWLFTAKHRQLAVKHRLAVEDLEAMAVYQTCPERIRLEFPRLVLRLRFDSETEVQELVRGLRNVWEHRRGIALEEVTKFHLQGGKDVVTMQTLLMEDSVSPQSFDLSQWIKVTSQSGPGVTAK